jgi:Fe-S oxidoreductase
VREALDTGAQVIATACPFCLNMLDDAVKTMGVDDKLEVQDIMELVNQGM